MKILKVGDSGWGIYGKHIKHKGKRDRDLMMKILKIGDSGQGIYGKHIKRKGKRDRDLMMKILKVGDSGQGIYGKNIKREWKRDMDLMMKIVKIRGNGIGINLMVKILKVSKYVPKWPFCVLLFYDYTFKKQFIIFLRKKKKHFSVVVKTF